MAVVARSTGRPAKGYRNAADKRVVGTTTACKDDVEGLLFWANRLGLEGKDHREARDEAASIGRQVHDAIDRVFDGQDPTPSLQEMDEAHRTGIGKGMQAFSAWLDQTKIEVTHREMPLVSEMHQFGGTPDGIGILNGKTVLLDWKTGPLRQDHLLQMGAYRELLEENGYGEVEEAHVLRFDREVGTFMHMQLDNVALELGWEAFEHRLALYQLMKRVKRYTR